MSSDVEVGKKKDGNDDTLNSAHATVEEALSIIMRDDDVELK
jgi:hypothetical protein